MNWKSMSLVQKIATVISGIAAVIWLICQVKPELFSVDLNCPAIAVFTVCEAVTCWQSKRKWAYLFIVGAVISMAVFILELSLLK